MFIYILYNFSSEKKMELDKFESNAEIQDLFFNFNGIGKEDFKEEKKSKKKKKKQMI